MRIIIPLFGDAYTEVRVFREIMIHIEIESRLYTFFLLIDKQLS